MSNNRKVLKTATNELGKAKAPAKPIDKPYSQPIVSSEGYKQGPPPSGSHYRIPGNGESTSIYNPTPYPLNLVGPNGTQAQIGPWDTNTQNFNEPYMDEYPQDEEYHEGDYTEKEIEAFKAGGYVVEDISVPSLTQAKKGGSLKKYSRSLEATNKLLRESPLLKKAKSKKKKIFDPSSNYFDVGGIPNLPLREGREAYERLSYTDNDRMAMAEDGGFLPEAQTGKTVKKKSPYQLQEEARKKAGQSKYDMLETNKPQVSENTKTVIANKPIPTVSKPVKTAKEESDARLAAMFSKQNAEMAAKNPAIDPQTGKYRSMSAGEADWVWSAPIAGSAGLKAAGAIGSMALPGMSAVPGATVGNLVNSGLIANSLYNTPKNVESWYDVSQGNKDWKEAALESGEIAAGMIGSGAGLKSIAQDINQGIKLSKPLITKAAKKVPQIAKGLIDEGYPALARKSINKLSPLNLVPGYGSKLKGATVPMGNVLEDVVQGSNLVAPKNKMMTLFKTVIGRKTPTAPISSAKNINKNSSNIFSAKIDPTKQGTNLSFSPTANQTPGTTYRDLKQKVFSNYDPNYKLKYNLQSAGKDVSEIPLLDPGASLHRRLPFSNRYVNVDPQKALNNKFQWSTAGTGAQNLAEKYAGNAVGLGALTAGAIGGMGAYYGNSPIETLKGLNQINPETGISIGKGIYDDYKKNINFKDYISKPDPYFLKTSAEQLGVIKKAKGGTIEMELDDDMIQYLLSQGYDIEDID